jgi:hypothetical protein
MGFNYTDLPYGWKVLAGIVITGTTIYIANNLRHEVQQIDIIQPVMATVERCYATQYATNPLYRVSPPSFTRTWYTNNPYSVVTNSVTNWYMARYTNVVTNTIGFYIDKPMMDSLDTTIKQLVPYYGWSNSPGENMTVTGLWAYLGIGDHTSEFTSVPCWTNDAQVVYPINFTNYYPNTNAPTTNVFTSLYPETVRYAYGFWSNGYYWTNRLFSASNVITTTNLATYGNYAQQIYVVALQERYKVLNAMRYMIDENKSIVSNVYFRDVVFFSAINSANYSNKITGAYPVVGYFDINGWGSTETKTAEMGYLGLDFYYYNTDYVQVGVSTFFAQPTWDSGGWPMARWNTTGQSETNVAGGNSLNFYSYANKYFGPLTNTYEYRSEIVKSKATLKWANYQYTNIPSSFYVYAANATRTASMMETGTEITTNEWRNLPRTWDRTFNSMFEENFVESNDYTQISSSFIDIDGIYNVLNLGNEFEYPGSFPPPNMCSEPTGWTDYLNNEGSIGTSLGMSIPLSSIKGIRDFQFSYCTERFW